MELDNINLKTFMLMRKLIPRRDYTLIKNRMSARDNRSKKRDRIIGLKERNRSLLTENERLKRMLSEKKEAGLGTAFDYEKSVNAPV